jgi:hypothetical protein
LSPREGGLWVLFLKLVAKISSLIIRLEDLEGVCDFSNFYYLLFIFIYLFLGNYIEDKMIDMVGMCKLEKKLA